MVCGVERGLEIGSNARSYAALDYAFPFHTFVSASGPTTVHLLPSRSVRSVLAVERRL